MGKTQKKPTMNTDKKTAAAFFRDAKRIQTESKAAVTAAIKAMNNLAKNFILSDDRISHQGKLLTPLLQNLFRESGTCPIDNLRHLTWQNRKDFAAVALGINQNGFPKNQIRDTILHIAGIPALNDFLWGRKKILEIPNSPQNTSKKKEKAAKIEKKDAKAKGYAALKRIANKTVCSHGEQTRKIHGILFALHESTTTDLSNIKDLNWENRKDICAILKSWQVTPNSCCNTIPTAFGMAAKNQQRQYKDGILWFERY
jgi:hypothetical protein